MSNDINKTQSELYKETHASFEDVMNLLDDTSKEGYDKAVRLTRKEVSQGRNNKRVAREKVKTFANTPIYRSFHTAVSLTMQIIQIMPKKTVKISDIILEKLTEAIRWSAAAYEQNDAFLKHNSLCEAISLMYTVKVCVNSSSSIDLIGKSKTEQMSHAIETIMRQLVAWRSSIKGQGDNEDE